MKTAIRRLPFLLCCALALGQAAADVYTWVDEQGTVHFEDAPPAASAGKRVKKIDSLPEDEPRANPPDTENTAPQREAKGKGAPAAQAAKVEAVARPQRIPSVELFTTSWCPWCKKAREYFTSRGIAFTEYDIDKDEGALERKVGIDGDKRVPTAIIDGRVVKGYSPSGYRAAIERP